MTTCLRCQIASKLSPREAALHILTHVRDDTAKSDAYPDDDRRESLLTQAWLDRITKSLVDAQTQIIERDGTIERLRGALEKAIPWMALAAVALPVGQAIRQEEIDRLTLHLAEARSTLREVQS